MKKLIFTLLLCTSGGSGLGRSGTDLSKFAKGVDFKGEKILPVALLQTLRNI